MWIAAPADRVVIGWSYWSYLASVFVWRLGADHPLRDDQADLPVQLRAGLALDVVDVHALEVEGTAEGEGLAFFLLEYSR